MIFPEFARIVMWYEISALSMGNTEVGIANIIAGCLHS